MAIFLKFEGSNASRYNNALHAAYHSAQWKQLEETGRETLKYMNVSNLLYERYAAAVHDLAERSMEPLASTATGDTSAYDVERDRLLSMLYFLVSSGTLSAVAEEQSAAKKLDVILRPYKGIQGKAMDEETQLVEGLLLDLRETEAAKAVTTLRLDEILTQLEAANDAYGKSKEGRIKARQEKHLQTGTRELRQVADDLLEEIQDLIRSTGVIAATSAEEEVLKGMVISLMDDMNGVTRNFKTVFNQSTAQKEAAKKPDGSGE